ncbi:protein translocase subunit SecF [bacterium]|nr:protein translocase subunit SecF [bacterium]
MKIKLNVVKYRWLWMILSTCLLLPGIIAMIYSTITYPTHTPLKVGIDFTGGTISQFAIPEKISVTDKNQLTILRSGLEKANIENPYVQILGASSNDESMETIISIRTKFIDKDSDDLNTIKGVIQSNFPDAQLVSVSSVGPTLGTELLKNSMIAVTLAFLGIIAYLTIRFRFDYALAAFLGLLHDTLFVLGIFSILGLALNVQVDGLFITAILTVIGFSINDTIVTFDRIRENIRYYSKKMSFSEIVDASVNQTIARSINTSTTTGLTLLALYVFGGVTTKDFVLAMLLGVIIGTYSSIFFCSMLLDWWNNRKTAPSTVGA